MMNDFWVSSSYGLSQSNPNTGVIESNLIDTGGQDSKLVMKIEHGIRQASSEIFITHLANVDDEWVRVPGEENLEENVLRNVLDYFASTPPSGGTSLVALNLNYGQAHALSLMLGS